MNRFTTAGIGTLKDRAERSTGLSYNLFMEAVNKRPLTRRLALEEHPRGCIHKCRHCYMVSPDAILKKEPFSHIDIGQIIENNHADYVSYEPQDVFLDPDFVDIIRMTKQTSIEVSPMLVCKNPNLLRAASKLPHLDAIICSLHGDATGHCRLTGLNRNEFPDYIRGLRMIAESPFNLELQTAVCRLNYECIPAVAEIVRELDVKEWSFNRILPVGRAANWQEDEFLYGENAKDALRIIFECTAGLPDDVYVWLESTWGVNFYSKRTFAILSGQMPSESVSRFFCDATNPIYSLHVSLNSNRIFPCPFLISFPEMATGRLVRNRLEMAKDSSWDMEDIHNRVRGICSKDSCKYHFLCGGGCRVTAFSFARKRSEREPMYSGMDFCVSRYIDALLSVDRVK